MPDLERLFANNREWSERMRAGDAEFFERLSGIQSPEYLWIGCSDSRVPANEILGMLPGEVFVHRNIANVVVHSDLNLLSVLQYAVDVLRVRRILIVGHYGCGGVRAVHDNLRLGLVDNWLRHIQDVRQKHREMLRACPEKVRVDRLCELNVIEQVLSVGQTTILQDAWARGQEVFVHGWIFGLNDGLVRDLGMTLDGAADVLAKYTAAIEQLSHATGVPPALPLD
ncbi:carbonate dehydratase [Rhodocyclus tenuis]|uniref:carbonate dehydratase n=1 Tax=Rhodocyclus gracilis TaxID=2929842 RepID=UPI001298A4FF|nr:carbonate dehydratase [Rhodocyclus gracilis]MRD73516.1 carbonate dehydratase [Rhodocyclus gracilis]